MLGWGRSSRPKFELLTSTSNDESSNDDSSNIDSITKQQVSTAESFFVESLESWRKHHNLPKLNLLDILWVVICQWHMLRNIQSMLRS